MKRKADLRAIVVESGAGKYYTLFDVCTSIKDMNKLPHGGHASFSVPCGDIDIRRPATIRRLLGNIRRDAKRRKIPFDSIRNLERFKDLASKDGMKFS